MALYPSFAMPFYCFFLLGKLYWCEVRVAYLKIYYSLVRSTDIMMH